MKTVFIYALKDPITDEIRYIGKASDPAVRFKGHLKSSKRGTTHREYWVCSLMSRGIHPVLEILDEVPILEWPSWEAAYIQFFKDEGCCLVNATLGGEGVDMTVEIHAKMSAAQLGNKNCLGKEKSPEHREKLRVANLGKKDSLETREKKRVAKLGNKINLGKKHSTERCEQNRVNSLLMHARRRQEKILLELWH